MIASVSLSQRATSSPSAIDSARVGSAAVAGQLEEVRGLRRDLDDAFQGPDAENKRNSFSKSRGLSSQALRRQGAYSLDPEALMKGSNQ